VRKKMKRVCLESVHPSTVIGAAVWIVIWLAPWNPNLGLGTIEKLFLLGPLVVVPLGLQLAEVGNPWWRLSAAAGVAASFLAPAGLLAGLLTVPWLVMCGIVGTQGLISLGRSLALHRYDERQICQTTAMAGLVVGGIGLLQSRWGMEPLGFHEPLVLLVAVHFHFAAFVTPLVAGEVIARMVGKGGPAKRTKWILMVCALGGSPLLATGYVLHVRAARLAGATLLVAALAMIAVWILSHLKDVRPRASQVLLGTSAVSVIVAMIYAGVYAIADFFGEVWIAIPQMARTHGVINAIGFSVCGLLGWLLTVTNDSKSLGSLTRRWQ
jgi:hypothetical protein